MLRNCIKYVFIYIRQQMVKYAIIFYYSARLIHNTYGKQQQQVVDTKKKIKATFF